MPCMNLHELRDTHIDILIALHSTKCRLATLIDARRGRGEATAELEAQLAANRAKAGEVARFLHMNPDILELLTAPC